MTGRDTLDMLEALDVSFDHATSVVEGVRADQLDGPTPCRDWDLRTLLGHVMGVVANCGRGLSGGELLPQPVAVPLEADLGRQFRTLADATLAAWKGCPLDGQVDIGAGPMPAQAALSVNLLETTTHTWDVARASAQDATLPEPLAETVLALVQGFVTDELRAGVGIDPPVPVPADSPPTDRLVAFLGRQP